MSNNLKAFSITCIMLLAGYSLYRPSTAFSASLGEPLATQANVLPASLLASCNPDKPVVSPDESISVRVWATSLTGEPLKSDVKYFWTVTAGRIESHAAETRWDLKGVRPGEYTATVRVTESNRSAANCSVHIIVEPQEQLEEPTSARGESRRETGRSFLLPDQAERTGFGLYSYLLFGSPPSDAARERYSKAIEAYLRLLQNITSLEKHFPPSELNITYLPVDTSPPQENNKKILAEWVLEHYDYARARFLLKALPGSHLDGPYIVSSLKPLSGTATVSGHLLQDLSWCTPDLAWSWVKEFLNQAAQEHSWEERTVAQVRLNIRTAIAVLAIGLPEVQKSLEGWIKLVR